MMRKHITRTLVRSDIHAYGVGVKDGKPELVALPVVTGWGKLTEDEARKLVKTQLGNDSAVTITEIVHSEETYKIDIDTFVKNAVKVEKTTDEDED